jgi:hypothetical protein
MITRIRLMAIPLVTLAAPSPPGNRRGDVAGQVLIHFH